MYLRHVFPKRFAPLDQLVTVSVDNVRLSGCWLSLGLHPIEVVLVVAVNLPQSVALSFVLSLVAPATFLSSLCLSLCLRLRALTRRVADLSTVVARS